MKETSYATVVILSDERGFCLAPKKGNIHKSGEELKDSKKKWNGYGGKQEHGETILQTAIRELKDESGVSGAEEDLELVARITFFWPSNETEIPDMIVYFFFLSVFEGEPQEGDEMGAPQFFQPYEVPFHEMMPADILFLPKIFAGEKITWDIHLGKKSEDGNVYYEDKEIAPAL